jgi:hypothetical protein
MTTSTDPRVHKDDGDSAVCTRVERFGKPWLLTVLTDHNGHEFFRWLRPMPEATPSMKFGAFLDAHPELLSTDELLNLDGDGDGAEDW